MTGKLYTPKRNKERHKNEDRRKSHDEVKVRIHVFHKHVREHLAVESIRGSGCELIVYHLPEFRLDVQQGYH
jgi:hypothetical protein